MTEYAFTKKLGMDIALKILYINLNLNLNIYKYILILILILNIIKTKKESNIYILF